MHIKWRHSSQLTGLLNISSVVVSPIATPSHSKNGWKQLTSRSIAHIVVLLHIGAGAIRRFSKHWLKAATQLMVVFVMSAVQKPLYVGTELL